MPRNEIIADVKPFNEFLFRSCYYHQLIAALSCFGIDAENVLSNRFVFMRENFAIDEIGIFTDAELIDRLGCRIRNCKMRKSTLINNIDKQNPLIVGVDCFYLKSRPDTYSKKHMTHYIMVYGYDTDADSALVTDHDYANGFYYKKKAISLENLLYANSMFEKDCMKGKKNTSRIISRKSGGDPAENINVWQYVSIDRLEQSREASKKNVAELKRIFAENKEIKSDHINTITNYLRIAKEFYNTQTRLKVFSGAETANVLARLVSAYMQIISAFCRIRAKGENTFPADRTEKLSAKADEINALEDTVFGFMKGLIYG